jgi:hypothetical protein
MLFNQKKSNISGSEKLRDQASFLVDLRQRDQLQRVAKSKESNLKKSKELSKNRKNFSLPVSLFASSLNQKILKPKKNKRFTFSKFRIRFAISSFRKLNIDLRFLKSVNYWHWRQSRKFRFEHQFIKEARDYFQEINYSSWQLLRKRSRDNKKEKEAKNSYLLSWYRSLFAFIVVLMLIILPFKILAYFKFLDISHLKEVVIGQSFSAFDNLAAAADEASNLSWTEAMSHFALAANDFSSAQAELEKVDDWLLSFAAFAHNPDIKMAASSKKFLAAGVAAADLGSHLSAAASVFAQSEEEKNWGILIDSFVEHGNLALLSAYQIQTELEAVNSDTIPSEYRDQFVSFRDQSRLLSESLATLLSSAQSIKSFLGVSQDKRYLLVFQNNTEMRGSGGFLGSYALVDIREGEIRKLEVPAGGSYDTEAGMRSFIKSPRPLWLISPRWYFWDANWWPDWPTTARSLMWFYEKSDGPSVDGVISFTPDVLEDLLRITGEIDLSEEYGLVVNADNFWELIQTVVEKPNLMLTHPDEVRDLPDSPENKPKKIIGDLMFEIMDRLPQVLSAENLPALLVALEENLGAKNILMYFNDDDLQKQLVEHGLDAAMAEAPHDYLMITHTNIAGQKSDRKMSEKVEHATQILNDGSIINTLTIHRTHTGSKNEILTGVRNVDWLRVYVPSGSLLLSAHGFRAPNNSYFKEPETDWETFSLLKESEERALTHLESGTKIYPENKKTVFANWVMTDPGETSVITLKYRLPFKLKKHEIVNVSWQDKLEAFLAGETRERYPFSLLVQKQPGAKGAEMQLSLSWPNSWEKIWSYPKEINWHEKFILNRDSLRAVLLEK